MDLAPITALINRRRADRFQDGCSGLLRPWEKARVDGIGIGALAALSKAVSERSRLFGAEIAEPGACRMT